MPFKTTTRILALAVLFPLLTGCLEKETVVKIPDAENQMFTNDGRLIVTGGKGIYEVVNQNGSFSARALSSVVSSCNYAGLAQLGDWVFTVCQERSKGLFRSVENHLLAARVVAGQPLQFVQVERAANDPIDNLDSPKGLAVSPVGDLLLANDVSDGRVSRMVMDLSGAAPRIRTMEMNWFGAEHGISNPRGIRVVGRQLFVSNSNSVKRYVFNTLGNIPLNVVGTQGTSVKNEATVYSVLIGQLADIQPHCGGVAIANRLEGRLLYAAPNGTDQNGLPKFRIAHESWAGSLQQPTSILIGKGGQFDGFDVLVTEKGTAGDTITSFGNKLVRVKSEVDLNDPLVCEVINEG